MTPRALIFVAATALVAAGTAWSQLNRVEKTESDGSRASKSPTPASAATSLSPLVGPAVTAPVVTPQVPAHRPASHLPVVHTGVTSYNGIPASVACATCHSTLPQNRELGQANSSPTKFHLGLHYQHGAQSCLSCHHGDNYDTLRLADGRSVPFSQAQQLCAQCHGPQTRDYLNGSHGGMTGYWDKRRGERQRNTCTDCHDPHQPAYPVLQPIFKPRDRGALQQAARAASSPSQTP